MKQRLAVLSVVLPIGAFSGYMVFALYNHYYNYKEIPIANAVTEKEMIEQEMNAFRNKMHKNRKEINEKISSDYKQFAENLGKMDINEENESLYKIIDMMDGK